MRASPGCRARSPGTERPCTSVPSSRSHASSCTSYESVVRHDSFDGEHFQKTQGYEVYAQGAQALRDAGTEAATQAYLDAQAGLGTPEQIIEKFRRRMEIAGPFHAAGVYFYGGMTVEEAKRSMALFAKEVMSELRNGSRARREPRRVLLRPHRGLPACVRSSRSSRKPSSASRASEAAPPTRCYGR